MKPSTVATPSAAVLKVVSCLNNDSGAGSRDRSGPGHGTGVGTPPRFTNYLILFSSVSTYFIMLSTTHCCYTSMLSDLAS